MGTTSHERTPHASTSQASKSCASAARASTPNTEPPSIKPTLVDPTGSNHPAPPRRSFGKGRGSTVQTSLQPQPSRWYLSHLVGTPPQQLPPSAQAAPAQRSDRTKKTPAYLKDYQLS